jgi:PAS domain S-box-containing protein
MVPPGNDETAPPDSATPSGRAVQVARGCAGPDLARRVWALGLAAAAILLGITGWSIWDDYTTVLRESAADRMALAEKLDLRLSANLRYVDRFLTDIRERAAGLPPGSPSLSGLLKDRLGLMPGAINIVLTGRDGSILAAAEAMSLGIDVSGRSYFTTHARSPSTDEFFLSEPFDTTNNRNVLVASRPIRGPGGEFAGTVGIALSSAFFTDILQAFLPSHNGGITLFGRDYIVRMRIPDPARFAGRNLKGMPYAERFLASGNRREDYLVKEGIDGVERLVVFHSLDFPPDMAIAVSEGAGQVLAPWTIAAISHSLAALTGAALVILLTLRAKQAADRAASSDAALSRADVLFSTLLASLPVEAWARDKAGNILFQNELCAKNWGKALNGPFGQQKIPVRTLDQWKRNNAAALAGETVSKRQSDTLPDGRERTIHAVVGPIRQEGEIIGVLGVNLDITGTQRLESELMMSEQRYGSLVEGTRDLIASLDHEGRVLYLNHMGREYFSSDLEALAGTPFSQLFHPEDREFTESVFLDHDAGEPLPESFENRIVTPDGHTVHMLWNVTTAYSRSAALAGYNCIGRDVTPMRIAADAVRRSLAEKEVMLKEIHHRVKNNLQIILSLIDLQSGLCPESQVPAALTTTRDRIRSMALIHEQLYRSRNLSSVDMGEYARALLPAVSSAYAGAGADVEVELEAGGLSLPLERAIPLGLLVNELVANAYKYAFTPGKPGRLSVKLERDGDEGRIVVADDGAGLPEGFSLESSATLGMQLVVSLADQLGGTLDVGGPPGARFTVRFPLA